MTRTINAACDNAALGWRSMVLIPEVATIDAAVRGLFVTYCQLGDVSNVGRLSSAKFSKLVREAGLINSSLTSTDVDLIFARRSRATRLDGAAPSNAASNKKTLSYAEFLAALTDVADKRATGQSMRPGTAARSGRLLLLLLENVLPLATRSVPGGGALAGAALTDRVDGGALGEEELLARCALLEAIFCHYCRTVHIDPAAAEAEAAPFWEAIQIERAVLIAHGLAATSATAGVAQARGSATAGEGATRGHTAVVDVAAWQRFAAHFAICPTLLSKQELSRLFHIEAARAPPTGLLSFPQFAHALGATAAAAFPPPLGSRSFDDGGTQSVLQLFAAMKLDDSKTVQQRLALSGRSVGGLADAIARDKARPTPRPTRPMSPNLSLPRLPPSLPNGATLALQALAAALAPAADALAPDALPPPPTPMPPCRSGGESAIGGSELGGVTPGIAAATPGIAAATPDLGAATPVLGGVTYPGITGVRPGLGLQLSPRAEQNASPRTPVAQQTSPSEAADEAGAVTGAQAMLSPPRLTTPLLPSRSTTTAFEQPELRRSSPGAFFPGSPLLAAPLPTAPLPASSLPLSQPASSSSPASGAVMGTPASADLRAAISPSRMIASSAAAAATASAADYMVTAAATAVAVAAAASATSVAADADAALHEGRRFIETEAALRAEALIKQAHAAADRQADSHAGLATAAIRRSAALAAAAFEADDRATALAEQRAGADERAKVLVRATAQAEAQAEAMARETAHVQQRGQVLAMQMAAAAAATAKQEEALTAIEARCAGAQRSRLRWEALSQTFSLQSATPPPAPC